MKMNVDEVLFSKFYKVNTALKDVNFTIFGYQIEGAKYERLWYHLLGRKITVNRRASDIGFSKAEAEGGAYFMISNSFSVGGQFDGKTQYGQTIMAHEGAHALIDMQNLGAISRGKSEAVAYLAEAIWRMASGLGPLKAAPGSRTANAAGIEPIRAEAYAIAGKVMSCNGIVDDEAAIRLVAAIRHHPVYESGQPHVSDGIA